MTINNHVKSFQIVKNISLDKTTISTTYACNKTAQRHFSLFAKIVLGVILLSLYHAPMKLKKFQAIFHRQNLN